jgi:hypothetical protein
METLEKYSINWETIDDIINYWNIYIPDWMNVSADRNY